MQRILYTTIAALLLAACSNPQQPAGTATETAPTTITDLHRDGLNGPVKTYIHSEYNAIQQNGQWVQGDTLLNQTIYSYDTTGTLLRAADIVRNSQQAGSSRQYKHAPGQPVAITGYEQTQPVSRGIRTWAGDRSYTEKTFRNFDKNDTTNWNVLQQVTLNSHHLIEKNITTIRAGADTGYTTTAYTYYTTDNRVSKKVLYNGADSITITYTTLEKDDKGNPTKTLKQYPQHNEAILAVDSYEYY